MDARNRRLPILCVCLTLVLFTSLLYWPAKQFDFVGYDDPFYVTSNPQVQAGLTGAGVAWAFGEIAGPATYWHPITWLSHMADCEFFGMSAAAHHLSNILFHAVNAALLFLVLLRYTGRFWSSAVVAALFAGHPLQVESVAWVTERKNLLSTAFFLLTLLAYRSYVERLKAPTGGDSQASSMPVGRRLISPMYLFVFFLFALGLMSKPMLVTLPCVLLLLDCWPLKRAGILADASEQTAKEPFGLLVLEKIPLLLLSAGSAVITILSHKQLSSVVSDTQIPIGIRFANACLSYVSYLWKTIWPTNLTAIYPYESEWNVSQFAINAVILVALTAAMVWFGRRRQYLLFGWLFFLGTLVPVIGLVQAGSQPMADRFMYLPLIGLFIAVVFGVSDVLAKLRFAKVAALMLALLAIVGSVVASRQQLPTGKNSFTLFERAIAVTEKNAIAHYNLGYAYTMAGARAEQLGQREEGNAFLTKARTAYTRAIEITPNYVDAHINLAALCDREGKHDEAMAHYRAALQKQPRHSLANFNVGVLLERENKLEEAAKHYSVASEAEPSNIDYRLNLANALGKGGQNMKAIGMILDIVKQNPNSAEANYNAGNVMMMQQNLTEALRFYGKAVQLKPAYPEAQHNIGTALAMSGKMDQATVHFAEAVRFNPRFIDARLSYARALGEMGKTEEAVLQYREVLSLHPDVLPAILQLGWVLSSHSDSKLRNGSEALKLAMRAAELTKNQDPESLDLLGAAYAETEQFTEAAKTAREAIKVANTTGRMDLTAQIGKRLEQYQAGKPARK